jgi:hypothetical protein
MKRLVQRLRDDLGKLPTIGRNLLRASLVFWFVASLNFSIIFIRESYMGKVLPERERRLQEFLNEPSNTRTLLGGDVRPFKVVFSESDTFVTYTTFHCVGSGSEKQIGFDVQVFPKSIRLTRTW